MGPDRLRFRTAPCLALFVSLLVLMPLAVHAEVAANGVLRAQKFRPLPKNTPLALHFDVDSVVNNKLMPIFRRALEARHYPVREDSPITLDFATDVDVRTQSVRNVVTVELSRQRNRADAPVVSRIYIPLLGANGSPSPSGRRFQLTVRITGADGQRVWTGELIAVLLGVDRQKAFRTMVPILLDHLDQTAR